MYRPKGVLWKNIGPQSILIGNHHQFIIQFLGNLAQIGKGFGVKNHFFKGVYLLIYSLFNDGSVPIYK